MFANSQSVLIRCDWRPDSQPQDHALWHPTCPTSAYLPRILNLLNEDTPWYFTATDPLHDTYCLTNAATRIGSDDELKALAAQLQSCLKHGVATRQVDFKVHALSSIYATDVFRESGLWCYYLLTLGAQRRQGVHRRVRRDAARRPSASGNRRAPCCCGTPPHPPGTPAPKTRLGEDPAS